MSSTCNRVLQDPLKVQNHDPSTTQVPAQDEESVLLPTTQNSGVEISWKVYERWGYLLHTGNTPISGHYQFYDAPRLLFDDGVLLRSWNFKNLPGLPAVLAQT